MVRLLGEVIAAPGEHREKRKLLMDGLCGLIGAEAWLWGIGQHQPNNVPVYVDIARGGLDDGRFARLLAAIDHPEMQKFMSPMSRDLEATGAHLTRSRQQMDPQNTFSGSAAEKAWLSADIGPVLVSIRPASGGGFSSIGMYRSAAQPMFSEREARLAHIVLTEVPWLHDQGWPQERGQSALALFPRLRTILNLLVEGWSRKQIAAQLNLSLNTIHGYVKEIYRHFGVHSQAELLARLARGDGGDQLTRQN